MKKAGCVSVKSVDSQGKIKNRRIRPLLNKNAKHEFGVCGKDGSLTGLKVQKASKGTSGLPKKAPKGTVVVLRSDKNALEAKRSKLLKKARK